MEQEKSEDVLKVSRDRTLVEVARTHRIMFAVFILAAIILGINMRMEEQWPKP
jgi:hypothetical protein